MRKPATLATVLPPIMAFGVAATLFAAYLAPFYGALDAAPLSGETAIVTEDFEIPEDMPPERLASGLTAPESSVTPAEAADLSLPPEQRPLERIAPRPPLSELGLATTIQEKPAAPQPPAGDELVLEALPENGLLYRPVALAAGRFSVGQHKIELAGIEIVEPDASCSDIAGESWQCGMQARTAFRSWLRGRAVDCDLNGLDTKQAVIQTTCTMGGTDIARWLVENGWARATFAGVYSDSQQQAEQHLRGIFGRKPASDLPLSSGAPNEAESEPAPLLPLENIAPAQPDLPFPPPPSEPAPAMAQ